MKKGFTLIELLVVIAILAVLAVAVVLVLNPIQLIKQARDSTRLSDLATLNSAIAFYMADVTSPAMTCFTGSSTVAILSTGTATTTSPIQYKTGVVASSSQDVSGTGWIGINFASTTGGSPISKLPRDPVSDTNTSFYVFACYNANLWYELAANMESTKYANGGSGDVESTDGGNNIYWYEVGNKLTGWSGY